MGGSDRILRPKSTPNAARHIPSVRVERQAIKNPMLASNSQSSQYSHHSVSIRPLLNQSGRDIRSPILPSLYSPFSPSSPSTNHDDKVDWSPAAASSSPLLPSSSSPVSPHLHTIHVASPRIGGGYYGSKLHTRATASAGLHPSHPTMKAYTASPGGSLTALSPTDDGIAFNTSSRYATLPTATHHHHANTISAPVRCKRWQRALIACGLILLLFPLTVILLGPPTSPPTFVMLTSEDKASTPKLTLTNLTPQSAKISTDATTAKIATPTSTSMMPSNEVSHPTPHQQQPASVPSHSSLEDLVHPSPGAEFVRDSSWRDSFPPGSIYNLRRIPLFPSPHSPMNKFHDSNGETVTVMGRYEEDGPSKKTQDKKSIHYYTYRYQMCSFENVCISAREPYNLAFHFRNLTTYLHYGHIFSHCPGGKHSKNRKIDMHSHDYLICTCFHPFFLPTLRPYEYDEPTGWTNATRFDESLSEKLDQRINQMSPKDQLPHHPDKRRYTNPLTSLVAPSSNRDHSHYWGVQKWVRSHHIAHWSQKLILFQSIFQHARIFYQPSIEADDRAHRRLPNSDAILPPLTGIVFQDTDSKTSDHEETILQLAIQAAVGPYSQAYIEEMIAEKYNDGNGNARFVVDAPSDDAVRRSHHAKTQTVIRQNLPPFVTKKHWKDESSKVIWMDDLVKRKYVTSKAPLTEGSPISMTSVNSKSISHSDPNSDYTCFKRLTYTPDYGVLTLHPQDTRRWRRLMTEHFLRRQADHRRHAAQMNYRIDIEHANSAHSTPLTHYAAHASQSCPPRRITLLYRSNRRILNYRQVMDMLASKFNLQWSDPFASSSSGSSPMSGNRFASDYMPQLQYVTIDEKSSSLDQYKLFSSTGLLLSSHSSQLVNLLFSHVNSGVIEITPEFYNIDFARYGHGMGIDNYHYMLGGAELQPDPSINNGLLGVNKAMTSCVNRLNSECHGRGDCILERWWSMCPPNPSNTNKHLSFTLIDLKRLESLIDESVAKIESFCNNEWLSGFAVERRDRTSQIGSTNSPNTRLMA